MSRHVSSFLDLGIKERFQVLFLHNIYVFKQLQLVQIEVAEVNPYICLNTT